MSKDDGVWMFTRGTLKAHYVKDGKAVCGQFCRGFEPANPSTYIFLDKHKCRKCKAKLEGSGTK